MGILDSMSSASRINAAGTVTQWTADDDRWYTDEPGILSKAGSAVSPELAMRFSAVYHSVNLLAKMTASLPLRMYRTDPKTTAVTEAPEHPLNDILEHQPNRWQTAWDFRAMLMMHLALRGNGYAEIIPGPRGFADRLEPLHPDRVSVRRMPDWSLQYDVSDERGNRRTLLQDEVLHLRTAIAPGIVGVSPVTYARETVGLALAAEEYGSRTFSNGARPSGVVTVPKSMGDVAFERFKSEWRNLYNGLANSAKTPILEDGAEFKPIAMTADDAQFLVTRQFQIEEIARWFDVPPVMLHHITNQTSWGTGVEAIMLAFVRNNLNPWLECWTQAIRRDLILAPNIYSARFDTESLIRGDSKAQAEFFSRLVLNGILTRNEAREALGYNHLKGLDEPLEPNTAATSDKLPGNGGDQPPKGTLISTLPSNVGDIAEIEA